VTQLVVALTGTDHHPFERLVKWVDAAAVRRDDVRFVVQHGLSAPPRVAEGHQFIVHAHLVWLLSTASAVVCHGGPGVITEAREAGHVPLCVPRDPQLKEHVDGHQQRFAAVAAREGLVRTVLSQETFDDELDQTLARAAEGSDPGTPNNVRVAARALVAAELDQLLDLRPFRVARLHHRS
jgi:UDP-N-acetylglucosamine transferase subunit ALG13